MPLRLRSTFKHVERQVQLPLPVLAADINSPAFLRACGVATEASPRSGDGHADRDLGLRASVTEAYLRDRTSAEIDFQEVDRGRFPISAVSLGCRCPKPQ